MDPNEIQTGYKRSIPIAIASITIPVGVGCLASLWLYSIVSPNVNKASFILFVGEQV